MTQRSKDPQFETAASDREGKPVLSITEGSLSFKSDVNKRATSSDGKSN